MPSTAIRSATLLLALAASAGAGEPPDPAPSGHRLAVDGVEVFYQEAGPPDAPAVVLLHGFPSSSRMFRQLIPALAERFHVIAPDYPGFGRSDAPPPDRFAYTFAHLAQVVDALLERTGVSAYTLYMQDYGGPVGLRLAAAHPERVRALVVQNAVVNAEGWNPASTGALAAYWRERSPANEAAVRGFLAPATTRFQYTQGAVRGERVDASAWGYDQALLDRPGNDAIQLELLYRYQDNVASYPAWQALLRTRRFPTLVVWGANDPFFTPQGLAAWSALQPAAEVHTYEAGHFALETHGEEIAAAMRGFLSRLPAPGEGG